ncbi:unnamed protein product [Cylindrotheca closterium]|uniref:VWFD domain-containing protein n=1 Tax=Cylindrotheca closterium TaxID=2856 RepID=A0AAD2CVJ7_9STRA|nr:unnamed protein product [Cylindrotheca closterium]
MKLSIQFALMLALSVVTVHASSKETLVGEVGNGPKKCANQQNLNDLDENDLPIQVTSQDGDAVTFEISQTLYSGTVEKVALNYNRGSTDIVCEVNSGVSEKWIESYTAVCVNGKAEVKIYLHFCESDDTHCDYCAVPDDKDDYLALSVELDCVPNSIDPPIPSPIPPETVTDRAGSLGDPHFQAWKGEHFEFHGQCDLVLTQDHDFADGLGLDVQIRTKLVRYWSYIKKAAIRIGNDILEIEGNADPQKNDAHHWFNLEYKGEATSIGGFPLSIHNDKASKSYFEIDLSSKYPDQKIVLSTYREFVRVDFHGATADAFGDTVGMLGDFKTGDLFARDGVTRMDDFVQLGNEWQVLPADYMLFRDESDPQFPKRCIEPEDPQGQRHRRLGESTIAVEAAEAACAKLKDELDRKDCVYDILATQDLDMVGAF